MSLQQPIAIPATSTNIGSPFLRAYPHELEAYGISAPAFLQFLDELNRAIVVSPPVAVLGLAGDIVGMVPLATAQIVGSSVSAAAKLSAFCVSKGRCELFVGSSNEKLFAPRGLRMDIVKLEVVAKEAGIPILDAKGKIAKESALLAPVSDTSETEFSGQQRRLMAIAPFTSPLELFSDDHRNVPENIFSKVHAATSERQRKKEEKKILKKREDGLEDLDKMRKDMEKERKDYDKEMRKLVDEEQKIRRKEANKPDKLEKELRKVDKERAKVQREYDEELQKLHKENHPSNIDNEEKAMRKIVWLLIRKQDSDAPPRYDDLVPLESVDSGFALEKDVSR
ncbi:hypothetical protein EK21DRAFT_112357 [Setomelanomma holmii]|uniref:Uncharacterized protein n=1 Tax=Setomelanomma holmii TaxID=210430 RepID=A0A9P4H9B8_9PLEO|nr:hypothetical protein EK21DRAFT_112357 [Setomelanomma holmii]